MESEPGIRRVEGVSALPRAWEESPTFGEALDEWMRGAPWLLLSAAAHVLVFFLLHTIPWDMLQRQEAPILESHLLPPPPDEFQDPPPPPTEEIVEPEIEEPVLRDADALVDEESADDSESSDTWNPADSVSTWDSDNLANAPEIGIGGPSGGPDGRLGRKDHGDPSGKGTARAVNDGLEWLARHQASDGSWDCDEFMLDNALGSSDCDGAGSPAHDVGVTGLALLAFLGDGNTTESGPYRHVVARGVRWLLDQQDPDSGLVGQRSSLEFLYDHAIATLALCEAYYLSGKSPILKSRCQHAVNYAQRARNPYGGWRYEVPANGESDTSVTGWMVFALASARDAGLVVDDGALASALAYFDEMTDPGSGRVGYSEPGGASSRVRGINDHYPVDASETMTSVALLGRIFLDQEPGEHPVLEKHAELVVRELPSWSEDGLSNDLYGWYYGTYAMYQMSTFEPSYWKRWNEAMKSALVDHQRKDGDFQGSWDPNGPWGRSGGRVYSTALGVLCLEVYYRYARVLGGR